MGRLAGLLLALMFGWAGAAHAAVAYVVTPVLDAGRLAALAVEMRLAGAADGETRLRVPTGDDGAQADVRRFRVEGATERPGDRETLILRHRPGAPLVVRYEIVTGYAEVPAHQPMRPLLRPDWFVVHGERAFVRPEGRDDEPVSVSWRGLPAGWTAAANLGADANVRKLEDGYLLGGTGWRRVVRPIGSAKLTLFYRPEGWSTPPDLAFATLAAAIRAGFAFWGDRPRDFFVPIVQLSAGDFGGRGLADGFLVYAGADIDLRGFLRVFTHEHQHAWISHQIGGFPDIDANLEAWLNEGFNDAVTARVLLRARLWTLEDFAADLNESLLRYGTSPVREAANRVIQDRRGSDFDVSKLPYDRGRLLALLWEPRLRAASGGRVGLNAVLQAQRSAARVNAAAGRAVAADALFPVVARQVAGLDLSADMARLVEAGAGIELPSDLFGACGTIETAHQPSFDRGFDLAAALRNGRRVTGLVPGGPAERAGLREGDRIRISEVPSHDSQTPLTYRVVAPDGAERAITYKPEGSGQVGFQRLRLNPALDAQGRERCRLQLSGG